MTKTASVLNVFQAMFLFLSLEFLSFNFVSYFDIRILLSQCVVCFDKFFATKYAKITT
jgi:hypothetical protein